jgi:hypothetical protein
MTSDHATKSTRGTPVAADHASGHGEICNNNRLGVIDAARESVHHVAKTKHNGLL